MSDRVVLHIEELVLHGFAPGDRYRIAEGVEREMSRLLTETELPRAWAAGEELRLDTVIASTEIAPGSRGEAIGGSIAGAIHGCLDKGGSE